MSKAERNHAIPLAQDGKILAYVCVYAIEIHMRWWILTKLGIRSGTALPQVLRIFVQVGHVQGREGVQYNVLSP